MSVTVRLPLQLRDLFETSAAEPVDAATVDEALAVLEARYPGLRDRLLEPDGRPRPLVQMYVNMEPLAALGGMQAAVRAGDVVWVIPAVAGG
jgi:molybdopterin converting factor small subunit